MFGEKSTAHVARSDGWEGICTKRHKKGTRYAPSAYYMMSTYAPGAYRIGGTRTRGDEVG